MASVFDYLFNRKDKLSPYFIPQEAAPPPVPLEPVLGEGQMAVLSSGEARRRLRLTAQESIRGKNRYQREIDFGRAASADSSGQGLLFMENPAVRATLKSMFERHCRESGLEKAEAFDELFELPAQDKGRRMARVLSGLLRQFEDQKVPRIEYTDAESLGGGVPQLLSQGFEAMVLAKTVQGSLRDQVIPGSAWKPAKRRARYKPDGGIWTCLRGPGTRPWTSAHTFQRRILSRGG